MKTPTGNYNVFTTGMTSLIRQDKAKKMINLTNKTALVTGLLDNQGLAWNIAKVLQGAGAQIVASCHPKVERILTRYLTKDQFKESRLIPGSTAEWKPAAIIPCDVADDTSIQSSRNAFEKLGLDLNILIHSVAFSREVAVPHIDTSREAYLEAMSISSYSLVALTKTFLDLMPMDGAITALSYLASQKCVPGYGGGMASAKAALECDARMLSYYAGEKGVRVNIVSPGPFASRAAKSIGDVQMMIEHVANKSPLKRAITGEDVANTVAFLSSKLARNISGEVLHVDAGYHCMGV